MTTNDDIKQPVSVEGTQEADITASSQGTSVNDAENTGVESQKASQEENAQKQTTRNLDAEAGKVSALQKQLNQLEALRAEVSTFFQKDKDGYDKFRKYMKESRNVDLGDYETVYGVSDSTLTETQQTNNIPSIESVKQVVRQELRFEIEAEQGFKEFIAEFPEMDPSQMDQAKKQEIAPIVRQVESLAMALKQQNPEMTLGKAYSTAYRAVNPNAVISKAKEEGEITGRLKELGKGASSSNAPASGTVSTAGEDTNFLTPSQKERYLELKRTPGKESIAALYLESARERRRK